MKTLEERAKGWAEQKYPNGRNRRRYAAAYLTGLRDGGWLPYPENKPEQVGWVLAYNANPSTCQATVKWWNGEFAGNECIVAWMPIPPYTNEVWDEGKTHRLPLTTEGG